MFYHISYLSKSNIPAEQLEAELVDIEQVATLRNKMVAVYGCLVYRDGYFLQYLEGDKSAVMETYHRIAKDQRHCEVNILSQGYMAENLYSHWSTMRVISKAAETDAALATINELTDTHSQLLGTPESVNAAVLSVFQMYRDLK